MAGKKYLRKYLLLGIYVLGVLGIAATGGGGDGDDDEDELIIQALYNYTIGGPLPDDPGNNSTIRLEKSVPAAFTLATEPNVVGTVICDQVTEVCELQTVDTPSTVLIDDETDILFGDIITLTVQDFWLYTSGSDRPVNGSLFIDRVGTNITVEVRDCGTGDVEVTIGLESTCYTWDAFEELMDARPFTDAALASLAWGLVEFAVAQGLNVIEIFPLIDDDLFTSGNPLIAGCDTYSGNWNGGPANPGDFTFFWSDDNSSSQVGPADSFRQTFNDCWFGDSTGGTLLQGVIDYVGYTEVIDQNGLLTRIGFESAAQGSGKIGGVALGDGIDPLVITETIQDGDTITPEPPISLTGRYIVVFE